jgi:antirestriction protein ArdC
VLLIVCQHPTATRVAGFKAWLELGYCVTKGHHAIKIWAPCPPSKRQLQAWREAGADSDQRPRTGWRLASVFAQDQVAELPPPANPVPLRPPIAEITGDSHAHLVNRLVALGETIGYPVSFTDDTGSADGTCSHREQTIRIAARLSANARLATLIHELSHALVRLARSNHDQSLDYAQEELVVESVAFCCCQTVGLDTSANSTPYLASWAETASLDVLEQTAELTSQLADRIESALSVADGPPEDDPSSAAKADASEHADDNLSALAA